MAKRYEYYHDVIANREERAAENWNRRLELKHRAQATESAAGERLWWGKTLKNIAEGGREIEPIAVSTEPPSILLRPCNDPNEFLSAEDAIC